MIKKRIAQDYVMIQLSVVKDYNVVLKKSILYRDYLRSRGIMLKKGIIAPANRVGNNYIIWFNELRTKECLFPAILESELVEVI